jgi:hypothetical protein
LASPALPHSTTYSPAMTAIAPSKLIDHRSAPQKIDVTNSQLHA